KVKKVYSGELTYAGNWDSYKDAPFWDQLDYIGIDAYFPLSDSKTPTVKELKKGWKKHRNAIFEFSKQKGLPVIFTEFGYRSKDYNTKKPWKSSNDGTSNMQAQVNAYKAVFDVFWDKKWFAGGFLWKWYDFHDRAGGKNNTKFTPQNKPVEDLIGKKFSNN
ncbi:MAG: glycoside hydrolase, partial [Flavobacteriales bacterium]